ncbi:MAG TPA: hypothetical protein EYP85_08550 [Armatimonadetes bacterium]|nr:hypothetical protein [Armatimonadota bacterium]
MMGSLMVLLSTIAGPASPATYHLQVEDLTLPQTLHQAQEKYGLNYLVVNPPARRLTETFEAEKIEELGQQLARAYDCAVVTVPPLLIAAPGDPSVQMPLRPFGESLAQLLRQRASQLLPPDLSPEELDVKSLGWELLKEICGGEPPKPGDQQDLVIPYQVREPERVKYLQAYYLQTMAKNVQMATAPARALPTRLPHYIELKKKRLYAERFEQYRLPIGSVLPEWQKMMTLRQRIPFGHWEHDLAPRAVQRVSVILGLPVTLRSTGALSSLLKGLEQVGQVQIEADPALAAQPCFASFRDCPLWIVLDALSIATGRRWFPQVDAERYRLLEPEEQLVGEAFALAHPVLRLDGLSVLRRGEGQGGGVFTLLWPALSEPQRKALRAGKRLKFASLEKETQGLIRHFLRIHALESIFAQLDKLDYFLPQKAVQGNFCLGRRGDVQMSIAVKPDAHHAFWLEPPRDMTIEEWFAERKRRAISVEQEKVQGIYQNPRRSVQASRRNYGTRNATLSRMRVNRKMWGRLVAGPPEE